MDNETRLQIIADVNAIMDADTEDKDFLNDLLAELTERW